MIFDTHAHLCSDVFLEEELANIMQRASENRIDQIVNIATNPDELQRAFKQKTEFTNLLVAGSTTPHEAHLDDDFYPHFEKAAQEKKLIAIGETGLDYYYEYSDREAQKKSSIRYMQLAKKHQLPLIIHCREAFSDLFTLLDEFYSENNKWLLGVLHCFTGSQQEAQTILDKGFYISCSGITTFKKSHALQEIFKELPLESIVIETDSPYLAPHPFRGKRNEPSYILQTAQFLAELRRIPIDELLKQLYQNSLKLFCLDSSPN